MGQFTHITQNLFSMLPPIGIQSCRKVWFYLPPVWKYPPLRFPSPLKYNRGERNCVCGACRNEEKHFFLELKKKYKPKQADIFCSRGQKSEFIIKFDQNALDLPALNCQWCSWMPAHRHCTHKPVTLSTGKGSSSCVSYWASCSSS